LTDHLVERLDARMSAASPLAVVGASGSGKSSVLNAGLLPALDRGDIRRSSGWPTLVVYPGADPIGALAAKLAGPLSADAAALRAELRAKPWQAAPLIRQRVAAQRRMAKPDGTTLVLIVDQFEELFTTCPDEAERQAFVYALCAAAGMPLPEKLRRPGGAPPLDFSRPAAAVVLSVRADFYSRCLAYPELVSVLGEGQVPMGAMTTGELREAIVGPADACGLRLEAGLVDLLLREYGADPASPTPAGREPGALPLLSHALSEIWKLREGQLLTVQAYRATGGIAKAIEQTADRTFTGLGAAEREAARRMLLRMVRVGEDTEDFRLRIDLATLVHGLPPADAAAALNALSSPSARLVTLEEDAAQLTHEALLRNWGLLRNWINSNRQWLLARQEITRDAAGWEHNGREESRLYRGGRLETAHHSMDDPDRRNDLGPLAAEFLHESFRRENELKEQERKRQEWEREQDKVLVKNRVRVRWFRVSAVLTAIAVVTTFLALGQAFDARKAKRDVERGSVDARADQLATEAARIRGAEPNLAKQLSVSAYHVSPTFEAFSNLFDSLGGPGEVTNPGEKTVEDLEFSRNGILAMGGDGGLKLWDMKSRRVTHEEGTPVHSMAFSRDGQILAAVTSEGVKLWSVGDTSASPLPDAPIPAADESFLAFRDRENLAVLDADASLRLVNILDLSHPIVRIGLPGPRAAVSAAAFSTDGRTLVAGGADGSVRLWDVANPRKPIALASKKMHPGRVTAVTLGAEGRKLATTSTDLLLLSDLTDRRNPKPSPLSRYDSYYGYGSWGSLSFSPDRDARFLAAGGAAGTVRVWELGRAGSATTLTDTRQQVVSNRQVNTVAFSPDGRTLIDGGNGPSVRLWRIENRRFPTAWGTVEHPGARTVAYFGTPGEPILASAGWDVRLARVGGNSWPVKPARLQRDRPQEPHSQVYSIAARPDGTLAYAPDLMAVQLWNAADPSKPQPLQTLRPPDAKAHYTYALAFNPDGDVLATAGDDRVIRLWKILKHGKASLLGRPMRGHTDRVNSVAFSPDGQRLASAGPEIIIWDVSKPERPRKIGKPLEGHTGEVNSVAFGDPHGQTLASAGDDWTVRLWNIGDRPGPRELATLTGHNDAVNSVAFDHKGQTLASASDDGTVRLWDVHDPARAKGQAALGDPKVTGFRSVAFSPDGQMIAAVASTAETIILWNIDPKTVEREVCKRIGEFTPSVDWNRAHPGAPYPCSPGS
jgi:WD40 repeat protein